LQNHVVVKYVPFLEYPVVHMLTAHFILSFNLISVFKPNPEDYYESKIDHHLLRHYVIQSGIRPFVAHQQVHSPGWNHSLIFCLFACLNWCCLL